jgi:small GTP-binding protein
MVRKKILLIGDFNVGKTSLIRRYVDNSFDEKYLTTIGVKISKKCLTIEGLECELLIWDVEGQTPHKRIPHSYLKGASGAIFVADVNRSETIEGIDAHITTFLSINPHSKYVIAYNKADLLTAQQQEMLSLSGDIFLTSAKENLNVERLFITLAKEMLL